MTANSEEKFIPFAYERDGIGRLVGLAPHNSHFPKRTANLNFTHI
jgi:hypothetical protein